VKRGDIVIAALPREVGKPRPALVVQADWLEGSTTVLVCPLTSDVDFRAPHRPELQPAPGNGLRETSLVMTDKLQSTARERCGAVIGSLGTIEMAPIEASMAFVLGLRTHA
jgi:mRNA interferase MazF